MDLVGSWTKCPNPIRSRVEHYWMKYTNYKYTYCDLCVYELQTRNDIRYGSTGNTLSYINHLTECKPEKDTL